MEPPSHSHSVLSEYVRVLRRRAPVIVLATVLVVASAVAFSAAQTEVYEARAEVLLQDRSTESLFQTEQRTRAVETEIRILESAPVRDAVSEQLDGRTPKISAEAVPQTEVFEVIAKDESPEDAAHFANAYATAYIDYRRQQAVEDLLAAGAGLQAQIDELQRQIDVLGGQIAAAPEGDREAVERNLGSQRDALVSQQGLLKQSLDRLQVTTPLVTGGAQLVNPATPPTEPVEPRPVRNGLVGLGAGLLIGIGLAFSLDRLDDTIRDKDDLARAAPGIPVIGLIPVVSGWRKKGEAKLVSSSDPTSPVAEAYRSLRTSISFLGIDQDVRTIQVSSPNAGEGKSATVANLALTLSRAGQRVMVLSCDLRRPRVHEFFGLSNDIGFTTVLVGEASVSEALQAVPGEKNLSVLASGPVPPNPSELLSSGRTLETLTALQSRADVVLIDSAPVLPVTDATVLASRGYPTLLIAAVGRTTRKRMGRSVELLRQVDARIVGSVLNGLGRDDEMSDRYEYRYEQRESAKKRRGWHRQRAEVGAPRSPARTAASPGEFGDVLFGDGADHQDGEPTKSKDSAAVAAGTSVARDGGQPRYGRTTAARGGGGNSMNRRTGKQRGKRR